MIEQILTFLGGVLLGVFLISLVNLIKTYRQLHKASNIALRVLKYLFRFGRKKVKEYANANTVVLVDRYANSVYDEDDLEDQGDYYVEVKYTDSGVILSKTRKGYSHKNLASPLSQQNKFFKTCGIDHSGGPSEYKKYSFLN